MGEERLASFALMHTNYNVTIDPEMIVERLLEQIQDAYSDLCMMSKAFNLVYCIYDMRFFFHFCNPRMRASAI